LSNRLVGDDVEALRAKWDQRYQEPIELPEPAAVLRENLHLLPRRGRALDLACGLGASALLLARHGLHVVAWDLSPVAIDRVREAAAYLGLHVAAEIRDVCAEPPPPGGFDCILVAHFLDRALAPAIASALRPGGLLFYQTFGRDSAGQPGPSDPRFRLDTNELLRLFPDLTLRFYREEGLVGDLGQGTRGLVQLIAQRPAVA